MSEDFIEIEQEYYKNPVKHSDPSDFGITIKESLKMRKDFLIKSAEKDILEWKKVIEICGNTIDSEMVYRIKNIILDTESKIKSLKRKLCKENNLDFCQIKKQNNIIEIAEKYGISFFKKSGKYYKTKCIWHKDENASLVFDEQRNTFYCFGCQEHGSVIDLVMKIENCNFIEACKKLN